MTEKNVCLKDCNEEKWSGYFAHLPVYTRICLSLRALT